MNLKRILLNNSFVRSFSVSSNVKNEANKVDEKFQQISRERTLNLVQIIGRVGHNPKVAGQSEKNEPNKKLKRVVLFSMATNEYQGMSEDGEAKFRTDWHRITLISPRLQEYALDKVSQGDRLHITGRLHYDLNMTKNCEIKKFEYKKPLELFESSEMVKLCAPMVRYTKLQFRELIRKYDCDLAYTPMIMSDSFVRSHKARDNEFTTNETDRPLIVQFAAKNPNELATSAQFVRNCADGVELNCGCPQKWAIQEGVGAGLIDKNDMVCEMVKETRKRLNYDKDFTVAVKIRLHENLSKTIDLCRQLESAGCSYLTVHARTKYERHEPIHLDQLVLVAENAKQMPVVANGDLFSLEECEQMSKQANVRGVMCARGLLENPALFAGHTSTPVQCVKDWVDISMRYGTPFQYFHQVLAQMLQNNLIKSERRFFNSLISTSSVLDFLNENIFLKET